MQDKKKLFLIGGAVVIILIIVVYFVAFRNKNASKPTTNEALPTEVVIPTVDNSVSVDLVSSTGGHEVTLQINNIPSGTQTIDYELSYNTKQQGLQGVIGTINLTNGESSYDKKITLGTCSSGTCVYHEVVGKIKLTLNFTGDYGRRVFEKEYQL